jgi:tetratricopeptide (TPR) repeat protein
MYLYKYLMLFIVLFSGISFAGMQNPQTDRDYFELGNLYYREKNYNSAISSYKKAIRESGDYKIKAWAFYNMGNCYYNKNDKNKARKYYIKSLEWDALDYDTKYNLELLKNPPKSSSKSSSSKNKNQKESSSGISKKEAQDILNRVNQSEKNAKSKSKSNISQNQQQNKNKSGKNGGEGKGGEKDW